MEEAEEVHKGNGARSLQEDIGVPVWLPCHEVHWELMK